MVEIQKIKIFLNSKFITTLKKIQILIFGYSTYITKLNVPIYSFFTSLVDPFWDKSFQVFTLCIYKEDGRLLFWNSNLFTLNLILTKKKEKRMPTLNKEMITRKKVQLTNYELMHYNSLIDQRLKKEKWNNEAEEGKTNKKEPTDIFTYLVQSNKW